ncbi:MAG: hypothetical protein RL499_956 [Actinomycetota bacterium]|jgi:hypothetical protein
MSSRWTCVFCGQPITDERSAASFLFMARRGSAFEVAGHGPDDGSLEGSQFFCHSDCFTALMDGVVRAMVFDPDL